MPTFQIQTAHNQHADRVATARSAFDVSAATAQAVWRSGRMIDTGTLQTSLNSAQSTKDTNNRRERVDPETKICSASGMLTIRCA